MNQKAESCDCVGITRRESKRLCMQTEESVFGIERQIEAVEALHANPRGCFMNRKPNRSSCINNRKKLCSVLMWSINGCKSCKHLNKFRLLLCKVKVHTLLYSSL
ncbi:hypothetical protein YC2023_038155 [Brassica napus]